MKRRLLARLTFHASSSSLSSTLGSALIVSGLFEKALGNPHFGSDKRFISTSPSNQQTRQPSQQKLSNDDSSATTVAPAKLSSRSSTKTADSFMYQPSSKTTSLDGALIVSRLFERAKRNPHFASSDKRLLATSRANQQTIQPSQQKPSNDDSSVTTVGTAKLSGQLSTKNDDSLKYQPKTQTSSAGWNIFPAIQRGCGNLLIAVGFGVSSAVSLYSNRHQFKPVEKSMVAMENFLKESSIDQEILNVLNTKLLDHIVTLGRIQHILLQGRDPRSFMAVSNGINRASLPSMDDASRYSRFALAAYGDAAIQASMMDASGDMDIRLFGDEEEISRDRVATHIGVDAEDIALLDVSYSGTSKHLRHFVAVDHKEKKVVLAIRGTFSLSEIIVDVAAFSRPFCGGQAHAEMATMAEQIWEVAGPMVVDLLEENPDYELLICGHSLGGGVSGLLNIMCHENDRRLVKGRKVHCLTYAACPVFEPLEAAPDAVKASTNYIHGSDVVPFLSLDSVRHAMASLAVIAESSNKLEWSTRMRIVMGYKDPPADLVRQVAIARKRSLEPKEGAPTLFIPSANNVWFTESEGQYDVRNVDSKKMALYGIQIHPQMMLDHFPQRYVRSLQSMAKSR